MGFTPRHMAYKRPLFGRSKAEKEKENYKKSIYYFWWVFLRLNEDYKKCCENGGKGEMSRLYDDFGDVFALEFKQWWQGDDRGNRLFAEKPLPEFGEIKTETDFYIDGNVLNVRIPLDLPKRYLEKKFNELLKKHHKGKRGVRITSTAMYPVVGHVDLTSIENSLAVYSMKLENPKMKLYELAQACGVGRKLHYIQENDSKLKGDNTGSKVILSNTAKRYLKNAERMIANVGVGQFPSCKKEPTI